MNAERNPVLNENTFPAFATTACKYISSSCIYFVVLIFFLTCGARARYRGTITLPVPRARDTAVP